MPVGWIERRDFEDKHQGNAAQVDNFRTLKKYRQGIFGCSEKKQTCWNEKWSYEGHCTEKRSHGETVKFGQILCQKERFYWEKKDLL